MNENEKQFFFTRAALSTYGRAKNQIPINLASVLSLPCTEVTIRYGSVNNPTPLDVAKVRTLLFCFALLTLAGTIASAQTYGDYEVLRNAILTDTNGAHMSVYPRGLAFDGTDLWFTATGSNSLCQVSLANYQVTRKFPLAFSPGGIVWDGAHLRITDSSGSRPLVWTLDRQGTPLGSQVMPVSTLFRGLTWDGSRLWGSDDWYLLRFEADGTFSKVFSMEWLGSSPDLAWDGTNVVAMVDYVHGGYGAYTIRVDPLTGNVSDYRQVGNDAANYGGNHITIGGGRMWLLTSGLLLSELRIPVPAPLAPLQTNWGVFTALDGFALPQRSEFFAGSGLGAIGSNFWYGDFYNVSKVRWDDRTLNTAILDLGWPIAGGIPGDIASDGTRVWLTQLNPSSFPTAPNRVLERTTNGVMVRNFAVFTDMDEGIAWDGQALWVGGGGSYARYATNGTLLRGPLTLPEGVAIDDLAWHNGELWILEPVSWLNTGYITRLDPSTGAILGRYLSGPQYSYTGLASDGSFLYAIAAPKRVGGTWPPGDVLPTILRLGMPSDMTPPKVSGVAVSSNQVNIFFNETMSPGVGSLGTDTKSDYLLESPAGTPIDLTPSVVTVTFDYQHQNAVSITGLALTPGRTFHLAVHGVYDTTGNRIREDGVGNSFTGVVGRPAISLNDGNFGIRSNRFAFNYIGSPGQVVVIERTSDFLGWSPIATNTVGSQPVNFADPNPGNYPRRFYRLRLQ